MIVIFFKKHKHLYQWKIDITLNTNKYNLRNPGELIFPKHKTSFFAKQTFYTSVKLYNALPDPLKSKPDGGKFSKKVRTFLVDKEYYTVRDYLSDRSLFYLNNMFTTEFLL